MRPIAIVVRFTWQGVRGRNAHVECPPGKTRRTEHSASKRALSWSSSQRPAPIARARCGAETIACASRAGISR